MSGFGGGTGNGGGDPGYSREHSGRRGQFDKERSKDEWKGKDRGSHKKDSSGVIPICHECGVKGHKRPECPNRVLSVRNPGHPKGKILHGTVGVNPCIMTLDSAADHTVVRADLVTDAEYTGRSCRVGDYFGYFRDVPMAKVWLGIEKEYKLKHEVLVVPRDCPHEVLLGNDLIMFDELYKLAQVHGGSDSHVKAITRGEAKRQREKRSLDRVRDGAQPVHCPLGNQTPPMSTPNCVHPKAADSGSGEAETREAVLVEVDSEEEDREVSVIEEDAQGGERAETLKDHRQWAEKGEKGYTFDNGLLVHELTTPLEQVCTRIVVPRGRRAELLKLAHSSILGGHFSNSKTTELLNRKFTWPRMSIDAKIYAVSVFLARKQVKEVWARPPCNHYQC